MTETISLWGVAIPTMAASAVGALVAWLVTHQLTKEIEAVRSRLHREEEAFRLAHSPRVEAAIKLWRAFCDFERATAAAVLPVSITTTPTTGTDEEKAASTNQQHRAYVTNTQRRVAETWDALAAARAEAECLMDEQTFQLFNELFELHDKAYGRVWAARLAGNADPTLLARETFMAMDRLETAKAKRADVVAAMRRAIAGGS